jgi:CheY-like chemotaxis protein
VSDTGAGIPPEDLDKVFDKFHQVTKTDTLEDKPKGTGLGLSICKQIIEHYGGRIWVDSELGKGSRFSVTVPQAASSVGVRTEAPPDIREPAAAVAADKVGHTERREVREVPLVMVVDDDAAIRSYLAQVMENEGYRVTTAENGRDALDVARADQPDLITMDLKMPGMDGKTVIASLRSDPHLKEIPIIVISVLPERDGAGGNLSFGKPIDEEHLIASTHLLLRKQKKQFGTVSEADQQYLVASLPGIKTMLPDYSASAAQLDYCLVAELEARLAAGFEGIVVIPSEAAKDLDLHRILQSSAIRGVVIDGSRSQGRGETGQ